MNMRPRKQSNISSQTCVGHWSKKRAKDRRYGTRQWPLGTWRAPTDTEQVQIEERDRVPKEEAAEVEAYVEAQDFLQYQRRWEEHLQQAMGGGERSSTQRTESDINDSTGD